jgi:cob(I)alamin adenosyltransferase
MKIYTRTGDAGDTSLFGGTRVRKNAQLGLARVSATDTEIAGELLQLQRDLFALGAQLADPNHKIASKMSKAVLTDADVVRLEQLIDRLESELSPLRHFILAGGNACAAALHVARTICRRAERAVVALEPAVDPVLLKYINRLSDLLFVLARTANQRTGTAETPW